MRLKNKSLLMGVAIAGLLLGGCRRAPESSYTQEPTESEVIASVVEAGVLIQLTALEESAIALKARLTELCENPTEAHLEQARAQWVEAYRAWIQAEPFLFGPGKDLRRHLAQWPVNEVVLKAALSDEEFASMLRAEDVRGYGAIEYILFASANAQEATAQRRPAHLADAVNEIIKRVHAARSEWATDYAARFLTAGDGDLYLLPAEALSASFRQILNVTEHTLRNRIGYPSTYFEGPAHPERLEAWRSGFTGEALLSSLDGIEVALECGGEHSFAALASTRDGLVEQANPVLVGQIERKIDQLRASLVKLNATPVSEAMAKDPRVLQAVYKQLQELQDLLVEASLVLELDAHQGFQGVPADARL